MIFHLFIVSSAVQIYEFSYIHYQNLTQLSWMMIAKPFWDSKKTRSPTFRGLVFATTSFSQKLVVKWRQLSRFPAKMTLAHARALGFVYWPSLWPPQASVICAWGFWIFVLGRNFGLFCREVLFMEVLLFSSISFSFQVFRDDFEHGRVPGYGLETTSQWTGLHAF